MDQVVSQLVGTDQRYRLEVSILQHGPSGESVHRYTLEVSILQHGPSGESVHRYTLEVSILQHGSSGESAHGYTLEVSILQHGPSELLTVKLQGHTVTLTPTKLPTAHSINSNHSGQLACDLHVARPEFDPLWQGVALDESETSGTR
uniref:Uncharacterized protein n=1 Tax=Timema shepardi TaxID=629360 RepID=A0A7R9B5T1_TIMSH|nr:unnamed protein product [Timema shepardi]